jgi:hypothetical protein
MGQKTNPPAGGKYINSNGNVRHKRKRLVDGDNITIGAITLWFTVSDFPDKESALSHYKKVGERSRPTYIE